MFSAWNFIDWLFSTTAVLVLFGIVTTFSTLVAFVIRRIWGTELGPFAEHRGSEVQPEASSTMRTAA